MMSNWPKTGKEGEVGKVMTFYRELVFLLRKSLKVKIISGKNGGEKGVIQGIW